MISIRVMLRVLSPVLLDTEDNAWHIRVLNYTQHHFSSYNYVDISYPEIFFIVFVSEKYNHYNSFKRKISEALMLLSRRVEN